MASDWSLALIGFWYNSGKATFDGSGFGEDWASDSDERSVDLGRAIRGFDNVSISEKSDGIASLDRTSVGGCVDSWESLLRCQWELLECGRL